MRCGSAVTVCRGLTSARATSRPGITRCRTTAGARTARRSRRELGQCAAVSLLRWSESAEYDLSDGKDPVDEKGGAIDQYGGYHPPESSMALAYRLAREPLEKTMMEAPIDDQVAAAGNGPKGYVVFCINRGTPFDVRYAPDSGAKADIAELPRWAQERTHATQHGATAHGEARKVKLGGFNAPTQDVSGAPGSARNETITAWAHGDAGATTCPTPGMLMIVAFDRFAAAAFAPASEVNVSKEPEMRSVGMLLATGWRIAVGAAGSFQTSRQSSLA
jgi:hypothetical protein